MPEIEADLSLTPESAVLHVPSTKPTVKDRKGHRKSRGGCFSCKKRKIKCQETYPTCNNCARLKLHCQYKQTSAIAPPPEGMCKPQGALSLTPNFTLTDFQLFHHYLVASHPHFPIGSEEIWLNYITPISHQSEFLMHALLGLSASHLSKISPASFTGIAQSHRLKASIGLNEALRKPLNSMEEADAVMAACQALLLQSWYMDDGLYGFLVLTRSCNAVSKQVRSQNIQALLAKDDVDSYVEVMNGRLKGTTSPVFDPAFICDATSSLNDLLPLCEKQYQRDIHGCLVRNFQALFETSIQAYEAHANVCRTLTKMKSEDFIELCDPINTTCQLLLAHFVALHLVMRPISCQERKKYTVTMYRIRMSEWIDNIYQNVNSDSRQYLEWPVSIGTLHQARKLDPYILCSR